MRNWLWSACLLFVILSLAAHARVCPDHPGAMVASLAVGIGTLFWAWRSAATADPARACALPLLHDAPESEPAVPPAGARRPAEVLLLILVTATVTGIALRAAWIATHTRASDGAPPGAAQEWER